MKHLTDRRAESFSKLHIIICSGLPEAFATAENQSDAQQQE